MEGILIAIISGLFTIAGVFLNHYLAQKRDAKTEHKAAATTKASTERKASSTSRTDHPGLRTVESSEEFIFFKEASWWVLTFLLLAISAGAGLFVRWVVKYSFDVFNVAVPFVEAGWFALILGGLAWGIAYVWIGTADAEEVEECLFALFDAYDDLFSPVDFSDFVRALLSAFPINLLISWLSALGLGTLAVAVLGADLTGVVYLVFGVLTFIGIAWFLSEQIL